MLSHFDLLMSYDTSADIPIPWITRNTLRDLCYLEPLHSFKEKNETKADVLWVGSNCNAHNGRQKYLKELFNHIEADVLWVGSNCNAHNGRQKYLKELFNHIEADVLWVG
eukprot:694637_1